MKRKFSLRTFGVITFLLLIVAGSVYIVEKGGYLRSEASAFADVPSSHWAYSSIKKSNTIGLFKGCTVDRFCPDDPLTRAQAAVVAVRFLDRQVSNSSQVFNDVPVGASGFNEINLIKELGITAGCGGGNYCPESAITRGQLAVFIIRAMELKKLGSTSVNFNFTSGVSQGTKFTQQFSDVPQNHIFFNFIEKLRNLGITSGCGNNKYCVNDPASRAEAAVLWVKAYEIIFPPAQKTKPVVKIVSPNGGEVWEAGKTYQILWLSEDVESNIQIDLFEKSTGEWIQIDNVPDLKVYNWKIHEGFDGFYKIRIRAFEKGSKTNEVSDESERVFTIKRDSKTKFPKLSKVEVSAVPDAKGIKPKLDALKDGDKYKISVFKRETNLLMDLPIGRERITTVWIMPDGSKEIIPFDLNRYGEIEFTVSKNNKRGDYILREVKWKQQEITVNQKLKVVETSR